MKPGVTERALARWFTLGCFLLVLAATGCGAGGGGASTGGGGGTTGGGAGSPTTPTTTIVPGQPAQAGIEGVASVLVPAAATGGGGTLAVERRPSPPAGHWGPGRLLSGVAISMTAAVPLVEASARLAVATAPASDLAAPATITFRFDPASIPSGVPASEAIWVTRWDPVAGDEVEVPARVDVAAGTVSVATDHFGEWFAWCYSSADQVVSSEHFVIRYTRDLDIRAFGVMGAENVVAQLLPRLERHWTAYRDAGFTPPEGKIPVLLRATLDDSFWHWWTGRIVVTSYADVDVRYEHEIAHEVFHAFQGALAGDGWLSGFFGASTMNARMWFADPAADLAASVATGSDLPGLYSNDWLRDWNQAPLWDATDAHRYPTSLLLTAAFGRNLAAVKRMHDLVFGADVSSGAAVGVKELLEAGAASKGTSPAQLQVDHAIWLETGSSSPLTRSGVPFTHVTPWAGDFHASWLSSLWGVGHVLVSGVSLPPFDGEKDLKWTVTSLSSGVAPLVEARVLRNGARALAEATAGGRAQVRKDDLVLLAVASGEPYLGFTRPVSVQLDLEHPATDVVGTETASIVVPHTADLLSVACGGAVQLDYLSTTPIVSRETRTGSGVCGRGEVCGIAEVAFHPEVTGRSIDVAQVGYWARENLQILFPARMVGSVDQATGGYEWTVDRLLPPVVEGAPSRIPADGGGSVTLYQEMELSTRTYVIDGAGNKVYQAWASYTLAPCGIRIDVVAR